MFHEFFPLKTEMAFCEAAGLVRIVAYPDSPGAIVCNIRSDYPFKKAGIPSVKACGRFVEKQDPGGVDKKPDQGQSLFFSTQSTAASTRSGWFRPDAFPGCYW